MTVRGGRSKSASERRVRRERLLRVEAAARSALALTAEQARAVLEERARLLAEPVQQPFSGERIELATFVCATERYALEVRHVLEIIRLEDFTPVPGAPDWLLGVTSLRGEILAIADIRKFFGLPERGVTDLARVLVLGRGGPELGVLADATDEIVSVPVADLLAPESTAGISHQYLRGVTRDGLIVLDGTALLADENLYIGSSDGELIS
jgi:purine-binding chemotaxis protein CheW